MPENNDVPHPGARGESSYLTATLTGALSNPATVITSGTALPGAIPFGTYAFT